ncbi:MAG: STAS domain-containing protein [Lachnospiraceae bacterium]|nr:STAS domain-containing protein [Lachnospiraceae bacterium]
MNIKKEKKGNCIELYINGWLDTLSAPTLATELNELPSETDSLVMDFTEVEYISSAGVRQIVAAHKQMKGNLVIRHPGAEVMDVLKMSGLDKKLNIEE